MAVENENERFHYEIMMEFRRLRGEIEHLKELINHPIYLSNTHAPVSHMHEETRHRGFRSMHEGLTLNPWNERMENEAIFHMPDHMLEIYENNIKKLKKEEVWDK